MSPQLAPAGPPVEGDPYRPDMPEVDFCFEVIDGRIVRKPVGALETGLATILNELIGPVVRAAEVGRCFVGGGYVFPGGKGRKPDMSVLSYERWAKNKPLPRTDFLPVIPDLAVEVVSPHDTATAVTAKRKLYLAAGVRLVWLVYPDAAEVQVFDAAGGLQVLTRGDTLTADPVVPGFALPLSELFPPPAEEQP